MLDFLNSPFTPFHFYALSYVFLFLAKWLIEIKFYTS